MADQFDLPQAVFSPADGTDERIHAKICDGATPAQMATVDTDLNLHVQVMGDRADDQAEIALTLSETGRVNPDGEYEADDNSKPASAGLIANERNADNGETKQSKRPTAVDGDSDSVCLDVSIHDESGAAFGANNPLPVTFEESEDDEICDFDNAAAVASEGTSNHDYSVGANKTLIVYSIAWGGTGNNKVEVQFGDGETPEVFTTKMVLIGSPSRQSEVASLGTHGMRIASAANARTLRLVKTNREKATAKAQDLYSTIIGVERSTV